MTLDDMLRLLAQREADGHRTERLDLSPREWRELRADLVPLRKRLIRRRQRGYVGQVFGVDVYVGER